jgi:hypothetical protein
VRCQAHACDQEAEFEVFWPGQTTNQCAQHAALAERTATAMGFNLSVRLLPFVMAFDEKGEVKS